MNQAAKAGTFSRPKFTRAVREHGSTLVGSSIYALMSYSAFDSYQKHGHKMMLFCGWMFAVFFVWAVSFIVRNIIRAARQDAAAKQ